MEYNKGDIAKAKIIKINDNGCLFTLYQGKGQRGFMPKYLMPRSFFDKYGHFTKSIGDEINVLIYNINKESLILSDVDYYENKQRNKEAKAKHKQRVEDFVSEYEQGEEFKAEVIQVQDSKVLIYVRGDIHGIIKKEDVSWNEIDRLEDFLFEGEIINVKYIKHENGKLYFSLKLLKEKPYDEYLYDLSLSDLLKSIGHESNVFIGQAKQSGRYAFIENLYSCDENQKGRLLLDPIYGYNLKAVVINQYENQIIDGEYYKVKLSRLVDKKKRLERNQLFQFAAEIVCNVDNPFKKDVEDAFKKLTSPAGNVAIAHLLKEVVGNMLAAKDRMFFELVQNADDAASSKGVHIKVKTVDDFLIVSHNGLSFDKDDFDAIVSAANGTKITKENKTGYKGIGFKTVFKEANRVFIKTGGYQFKFDKSDSRFSDFDSFYFFVNDLKTKEQQQTFISDCVVERKKFKGVEDIPWQLEPIWIDMFPEQLGQSFTKSNVAIALEIGQHKIYEKDGYCQAIEKIIINPKFMLFLRNTNRIDFNDKSVSKTIEDGEIILKNSFDVNRLQHYKILDYKVNIKDIEERGLGFQQNIIEQNDDGKIINANFIDDAGLVIDNIPSKIALNESTTISFAIPVYDNGTFKPNETDISIFAFLPTLVKEFDFTVFVNANFLLTPDRQHILGDNPWNYFLMEELANKLVELAANLCLKKDSKALMVLKPKYFEYQTPDVKQLAEHFNSAYNSALKSEAFILNHNGELAKQKDIIIDRTGLSKIVGADLFCQLLETEKCLPSEKIDSKILEKDIFEYIEILEFDDVIKAITDNSDFNEWFVSAPDEQKKVLYEWINNNTKTREDNLKSFVSNLPLFQFGKDYKSCEEIDSSEHIITTEHIEPIKEILSKLGFICSDNLFDEKHSLYGFVETIDEVKLFDTITLCLLEQDGANLQPQEKLQLFKSLKGFKDIGPDKLSEVEFFCNSKGQMSCLNEMFPYDENAPIWTEPYMISKEECFAEITEYLQEEFGLIWKNIDIITTEQEIPITDVYGAYPWTDEKYTQELIIKYKGWDEYKELLSIVEKSGIETKKKYLQNIDKIDLQGGEEKKYRKDSYEYRVLQLALTIYSDPSDFSSKIYFDGQCIKDFSVSDDVVCEYTQSGETKKVKMSLAKLLPQYQNHSDSIDKIKDLFESKKDLDKFFVAKPKSIYDVHKELDQHLSIPESYFSEWNVDGNAQQFLFATYYRRQKKGWNNLYVPKIDLNSESDEFVYELLEFLFDNSVSIEESPFTYHLKKYFVDKYFDSDFIFENEQILPIIEQWANDDKKKKYLIDSGVRTEGCYAIQFRKLFLEDKPINFIDKLSDEDIKSGIEFVATASGFEHPFVGKNQKNILLSLKDKCKDLSDNWDEEKMEEKSKEWDAKEYNEWIKYHNPQILIYPGILPSKLSYKDELLLNYEDSDYNYYYNKDKRQLFVTITKKIEDILFEVVKEDKSNLDIDDYKFLCWDGKVSLTKEEKDDYDNLKEEKDKIKLALQKRGLNYDDLLKGDGSNEGIIIQEPIEGANAIFEEKSGQHTSEIINAESAINVLKEHGFEVYKPSHNLTRAQENYNDTYQGNLYTRDGVPIIDQIDIHKEAMSAAKKYLESKNFDFSKSDYERSSDEFDKYQKWRSACQIHNVFQKSNGKNVTVVVKSCKGGHVYLSATDFQALTENKDNILILYDNNGCHSVSYNDLFKGSDINLIFDPEYTPEHYYAALGKIFTYIKRSTFAVKNPNFNVYDTIKSFGMDSKTEGIQDLFDDNDL